MSSVFLGKFLNVEILYIQRIVLDKLSPRLECKTPKGCTLTALAALNIAEKIIDGSPDASGPGYQAPAKAYGADLILELDGTARQGVGA